MLQALEGSQAIAQAVALCRPQVVAAYPMTPQTHIVENLAKLVADGVLRCELVSVESEFSAASVVLGSSETRHPSFDRPPEPPSQTAWSRLDASSEIDVSALEALQVWQDQLADLSHVHAPGS